MKEYVKCPQKGTNRSLTTDKIYELISKNSQWTVVINDHGNTQRYYTHRFEPVTQEKENTMHNDQKARTMVQNRSYIVGSFDALGKFSIASEPSEHLTEQKAKTEAKRLAGLNGEKTFVVMRFYAGFKSVQVQEI